MDSNREHTDFAHMLFGISRKKAEQVNHIMDYAVRFLGSQHRSIGHGLKTSKVDMGKEMLEVQKFSPSLLELYLITQFDPEKILAFYAHAIGDGIMGTKVKIYGKKANKSKQR